MWSEGTVMKENYTTPDVKLVGVVSQQDTAAFEFDHLLDQSAGRQDYADTSGYNDPGTVHRYY
jgi:hypothetical protein